MSRRRAERPTRKPEPAAAPSRGPNRPAMRLPGGAPAVAVLCVLLLAGFGGGMIYDQTPLSPMPPSLFSLLATPLCLALIALAQAGRAERGHLPPRVSGPARWGVGAFAAFALVSLGSILEAKYRWAAIGGAALVVGALGMGSLVRGVARDPSGFVAILWAHVCAAALVAALGLNEYLTNVRAGNPGWRVFGGFVNPDFLAGYLLTAIPPALGLFLTSRERHLSLAAGVAFVLLLLCLLFTQSRFGLASALLSLVLVGFAAWAAARAGVLDAGARRRIVVVGALGALALAAGAGPVLHRMKTARAESYSAEFRVLTWKGAARMAAAHPVLGVGIGTFETAYPPYAVVGFTRHGHGSLLQLLGETGAPGLAALLLGIGAACIAALRSRRPGLRLLDAAVVAAIVGSLAHSLTDSDLHVPAIALAFATLCGLALAAGGDEGDHGARIPALRWAPFLPALFLLWYAGTAAYSRAQALAGEDALLAGDGPAAIAAYRAAVAAAPGDVELRLRLATLYQGSGRMDEARRTLGEAVQIAPIGKALYRYARILAAGGDLDAAIRFFERARAAEPNNLQNLLALAEAYRSANRPADADRVYDHVIELANSDMGRVRPLPELVDWEFGEAYARRGETWLRTGDAARAEPLLRRAAGILGAFWRSRNRTEAEMRVSPEVRARTRDRYASVLTEWIDCLDRLGRRSEADEARAERTRFQQDQEADMKKE